ncbi:MAG: bifunctional DNA primase/polymerase [Candidatus Acidiferrales bacterium]
MSKQRHVLKHAKKYTKWGWRPVPVPRKQEAPRLQGWQKLRLDEADISEFFTEDANIGVLLGEPSKDLVDVDLDCGEAIFLAPHFLHATGRIHGRASKPKSHYWYHVKPVPKPEKFCDIDGTCMVEIRSTGQQTIIPPSIHPGGERVEWAETGKAKRIPPHELSVQVKRTAAATLIARHRPKPGSRHELSLSLAGVLLREGWDDIEAGEFISLIAQAANDEEWRARDAAVRTTRKRLDEAGKATGRARFAELVGADVAARFCEWLGISQPPTTSPGIRSAEAAWPKPLAEAAYHGLPGDIVQNVGPITEADPAGLLVQLLVSFGNAVGRAAHFSIGAAKHYTNLFVVLVGLTAKSRKGTSWSENERLLRDADVIWASRCLLYGGLASGEGLIWAVRDPVEKSMAPPRGSKQDQDVTKVVDKGITEKRRLVLETEFSSPLRVIRRDGNTLSAVIRRAWDKGDLNNQTKNSPARATGAHISIVGHITRDELLRELSASEGSNGFANRFLWVCVRRNKLLPFGGQLPCKTRVSLTARLQKALQFGRKAAALRFTNQAKKLWEHVYPKLAADVPGPLLNAVTSRAEAQVLRLSMIYALMDCSICIKRCHLEAALSVWRYCEDSARYIFGDSLGDAVADRILKSLRKSPKGLTRTAIRELFQRNRSKVEIKNALRVLREHRLARRKREKTRGRTSETWFAVRWETTP